MTAPVMMGITSPTGSHLPVLEAAAARLSPDSFVVEHGAGIYSTPLLARLGVRVLCSEPHPGWAEWARWMYQDRGVITASWKRLVPRLTEAALAFIDGPAKERGPLLAACFAAKVPTIVAHDTQPKDASHYEYHAHYFKHPGYTVTHSAEDTHRTTLWVKSS